MNGADQNSSLMAAILLAGGQGQRMSSSIPKQYLPLDGKPLVLHSLETLLSVETVSELVIVCAPEYRHLFSASYDKPLSFALPGNRRQDSSYQGLLQVSSNASFVLIHDAARPWVKKTDIERLIAEGRDCSACALGVPIVNTLKQVDSEYKVIRTLDRSTTWEMQTPQMARIELLRKGLLLAQERGLTLSDDLDAIELLGIRPRVIQGSFSNIKITYPDHLHYATKI